MKQSIKLLLGGAFLLSLPMFLTSCEDILGEWDKPAPSIVTPSDGGGSTEGIAYVKYTVSGTTATPSNETATDYTEITGTIAELTADKPYVVKSNVTFTGNVSVSGDASIILCDGASLNITGTIMGTAHDLKIFAQTAGTGELSVGTPGTAEEEFGVYVKNLEIHGGSIIAAGDGTLYGAGLEAGTKFTLFNGDVKASGTGSGVMTAAFDYYGGKIQGLGGTNGLYGDITNKTEDGVAYDKDSGTGWENGSTIAAGTTTTLAFKGVRMPGSIPPP